MILFRALEPEPYLLNPLPALSFSITPTAGCAASIAILSPGKTSAVAPAELWWDRQRRRSKATTVSERFHSLVSDLFRRCCCRYFIPAIETIHLRLTHRTLILRIIRRENCSGDYSGSRKFCSFLERGRPAGLPYKFCAIHCSPAAGGI